MSLEQAVQENTATLKELIEVLKTTGGTLTAIGSRSTDLVQAGEVIDKVKGSAKKPESKPQESPESSAPGTTQTTASSGQNATAAETAPTQHQAQSESAKEDSSAAVGSETIEYPVLQAAILALVPKNRDKVVEILGEFGAKKGTDLKPEQYADCYAKIKAELDKLELA